MDMAPFVEYWISDGLYGSLNCVIYDHAVSTMLSTYTGLHCLGLQQLNLSILRVHQ
jgi:hypothetical protein